VIRSLLVEDSKGKYKDKVFVNQYEADSSQHMEVLQWSSYYRADYQKLKRDYSLGKILTKHFAANESYFHISLFFYNFIDWFKRSHLPKEFKNMRLIILYGTNFYSSLLI
jgi:hypothetical protein